MIGICYGMQLLAHSLGGRVEQAEVGEFGRSRAARRATAGHAARRAAARADLLDVPPRHRLRAAARASPRWPPRRGSPVAAVEDRRARDLRHPVPPRGRPHPLRHARSSTRFLTEVCGCEPTWSPAGIVEEQVRRIREQVGDGKVICGLSGGVDSSVAALLVHRAVGDQLTCVFVDHGLMRKDEGEQVVQHLPRHLQGAARRRRRRGALPRAGCRAWSSPRPSAR